MRIAVIGATVRTGWQVVAQALARGHAVTAVTRHPESITLTDPCLAKSATDVLDRAALTKALDGCDAVVSTLGIGTSRQPTLLYSNGITNLLEAMRAQEIDKLVVVSAAPVGPRDEQPLFERQVAMPILDHLFGNTYQDMQRMETLLHDSEIDWVCMRPPRLVGKPATGTYRLDANRPLPNARSLTFGDLASALLDSLDLPHLYRRSAFVAN